MISRYDGISTLDWVAMPLLPYLYAVDTPADIPGRVDRLTVLRMRDVYRREHLEDVAPDTEAGGMPPGNCSELVGSSSNRTIYGFRVNTTAEQDAQVIAHFNDRPNLTRYSGAFRNCADFVRGTVDSLYPHAIRRNYIADLGLTTPKSVARGLSQYAHKHLSTDLEVFRIPQVPGDLPRSVGVEGVTESLLKRYGLPLAVLSPEVTAAVLVAYIGDGRFSEPKHAPMLDFVALKQPDASVHPVFFLGMKGEATALPVPEGFSVRNVPLMNFPGMEPRRPYFLLWIALRVWAARRCPDFSTTGDATIPEWPTLRSPWAKTCASFCLRSS